jgi:hypothetical protein
MTLRYGPTSVGLARDSNLAPALNTDGAGAFRLPPSRRQKMSPTEGTDFEAPSRGR